MKIIRSFVALATLGVAILGGSLLQSDYAHAGTNQCTWTGAGGNNNWSTAANWTCSVGTVPTTGYDIIFPYLGPAKTSNNDLVATNVYTGLWFTGTLPNGYPASGPLYTLSGNQIRLADSGISVNVGTAVAGQATYISINNAVSITTAATISTSSANNVVYLNLYSGLNVGGALTLSSTQSEYIAITGDVSGSAAITSTGDNYVGWGAGTTYTGNITATAGNFGGNSMEKLTNQTTLTVQSGASHITCAGNGAVTYAYNLVLSGAPNANGFKLGTQPCAGAAMDEMYFAVFNTGTHTYTGSLTINQNQIFSLGHDSIFTGPITGSGFTITYFDYAAGRDVVGGGKITLAGSTNNTATPNGSYIVPVRTLTLSDSVPGNSMYVGYRNILILNGVRGMTYAANGGELRGTGTVGDLTSTGATINPGQTTGTLSAGNVNYDAATHHKAEIGGTAAGQYDQLNVTGTVNLAGATLDTSLYGGFVPALNDTFTIINNDAADAITGTFNGLAEGAEFTVGAVKFKISYIGGTGNDVTLKATYVPGPPGTGFGEVARTASLPLIVIAVGIGLYVVQRKAFHKKTQ